jgi:hypothetical protein
MHHLRIQNTIGKIKRECMVRHKWRTRFDIRKPCNNGEEIYPLHERHGSAYFPFRNSKRTGRKSKPVCLGPIPVPNQNLAAKVPLQLSTYVIIGEIIQYLSINQFCGFVRLPEQFNILTTVKQLISTAKVGWSFEKKRTNGIKSSNNPQKWIYYKTEILHVSASRQHQGACWLNKRPSQIIPKYTGQHKRLSFTQDNRTQQEANIYIYIHACPK